MKLGFIYLLRNQVNDKGYVGQTRRKSIQVRLRQHFAIARRGDSAPIYRAIRKYGQEKFSVKVVWSGPVALLDDKERFYIRHFDTQVVEGWGYNCTRGGWGGGYAYKSALARKAIGSKIAKSNSWRDISAEKKAFYDSSAGMDCRRRISSALSGRACSAKECANHSAGLVRRYQREEERKKTSDAARKVYAGPLGAKVRKRQSQAARKRAVSGDYHSEEARRKMSIAAKKQWRERREEMLRYAAKARAAVDYSEEASRKVSIVVKKQWRERRERHAMACTVRYRSGV